MRIVDICKARAFQRARGLGMSAAMRKRCYSEKNSVCFPSKPQNRICTLDFNVPMNEKGLDEKNVAAELQGNTLRVYWMLLKSQANSVGPRDIQRKLGFSSPNLAVYHLDKLVELGLAEKTAGGYQLAKIVDVGILKQFTRIRGVFVPRQVLYASMWTTRVLCFPS